MKRIHVTIADNDSDKKEEREGDFAFAAIVNKQPNSDDWDVEYVCTTSSEDDLKELADILEVAIETIAKRNSVNQ